MFHNVPHDMTALADRAGLLRLRERNLAADVMRKFSTRFPELFFAVYTGTFRNHENMRIAGFWLLNRRAFENDHDLTNDSCVLLVMDVERKAATLSFGYRLDAYLDEEDTFSCLAKAHPHWIEARYADGIAALIEGLEKILIRRSTHARRKARQSDSCVAEAAASGASHQAVGEKSRGAQKENDQDQEVEP